MERPSGGLTFIIHLIILIVKWAREHPGSFLIVLNITAILAISAVTILHGSLRSETNFELLSNTVGGCDKIAQAQTSDRYIILRLDDVQAYSWTDISIKMIEEALGRGMPMTLGVIPFQLETDRDVVTYLKENRCFVEIALHGWNNRPDHPEFSGLSKSAALDKIQRGKEVLGDLTDENVITFIPPNNKYSEGTYDALAESGFKVISSEGKGYFDYTASTYDFYLNQLTPTDEVLELCSKGLAERGVCTIMLHPQDYADSSGELDPVKYQEYLHLLDTLQNFGASFITTGDLYYILYG